MPNLFVVGAEKCGTTSLHHYLGLHPEVSISSKKEPGYFARASAYYRLMRVSDRAEYLALFEAGKPVRGEVTPAYASFPELSGTPARIEAETDEPRFIYLVRDPVERIESALRHWAAFGRLQVGADPHVVEELPQPYMISRSRYMTQLEQYLEYFPPESILVVDSDQLRSERSATLRRIFEFIDVDPAFGHPGFLEERNPHTDHRVPPPVWRQLRSMRLAETVVRNTPDRVRTRLRRLRLTISSTVGEPPPEIALARDLRALLQDQLHPEVDRLRKFTGQKFPGWSF